MYIVITVITVIIVIQTIFNRLLYYKHYFDLNLEIVQLLLLKIKITTKIKSRKYLFHGYVVARSLRL